MTSSPAPPSRSTAAGQHSEGISHVIRTGYSTWEYHVYGQQTGSALSTDLVWSESAGLGFKGIEISQELKDLPPAGECRKQLDRYGLQAVSHWVNVTYNDDCLEDTEQKARFLQALGGRFLVCEGDKKTPPTDRQSYLALFKQFDKIGQISEKFGIKAAFHFHRGCLERDDEVHDLFENTSAVWFCPDIGHAGAMGWDPLPVLRQYKEKIVHVHIKDALRNPQTGDFDRFCELGAGNCGLDIKACLDCLTEIGYDDWAMVEQDHATLSPSCDALESRRHLEKIGYWNP